jgi:hypothetical protein
MPGMPLSKDAMQRRENIIEEFITAGGMFGISHTNIACLMQAPSKQLIGLAGLQLPPGVTQRKNNDPQAPKRGPIYRTLPSCCWEGRLRSQAVGF